MDLIIVESPTKARTLGKFLGSSYQVTASFGHVRDLPERKIGVDVEHEFEPTYVQTDKQKERVKEIKKYADQADHVYLATDPDREGEAIAWHVAQLLDGSAAGKKKLKKEHTDSKLNRIEFHEITKTAIEAALQHPRSIDTLLVDAQQARRVVDRLVGYKLSPLLWRKVRRGLSAGRVQSVAVRLVVEREREIEAFKPEEYWTIQVQVRNESSKNEVDNFWVQLELKNGEKYEVKTGEIAQSVEQELKTAAYSVQSVEKKDFKRTPPPPFTTSTLQQNAANKLGWSAKKTMQVAQSLYEEGFITYHRTDSTNMAIEAVKMADSFVRKTYGDAYGLAEPRFYKTKNKVAQEAHEAIRPTDAFTMQLSGVNRDQERLYGLIWRRFVATQMSEVRGESIKVKVNGQAQATIYGLEAKGETISFDGWLKLYQVVKKQTEEEEPEERIDEQRLPVVEEGMKLDYLDFRSEQKFTQPPARYNDASLIKKLEEMGIGRPSTYAPTLSTIQDRQYVERVENKRLKPTAIGVAVNDFLQTNFPEIVDYQFTATMEDGLDEIANGEKKWKEYISTFYEPFSKKLDTTAESASRVKIEVEKTGDTCPLCHEGEVVVRTGRFGKFLSCSRYPDCTYKGQFQNKAGMKCPKCTEGDVIVRRTKTGRVFYGCSRYPNCDFASWNKPEAAPVKPEAAASSA